MPKEGLEPSWVYTHYALNVARLPIPPLRLVRLLDRLRTVFYPLFWFCQPFSTFY